MNKTSSGFHTNSVQSNYASEANPIKVNLSTDDSELIPDASCLEKASATESVEVNSDEFIIEVLQDHQLWHQDDSISYHPIEPIGKYRLDYRA